MKTRIRSLPPLGTTTWLRCGLLTTTLLTASLVAQAWEPLPVKDDERLFMPGSQPGSVKLDNTSLCQFCHADYDPAVEPYHNWRGGMMAQAARDPLWLAAVTVALQDSIWALGNPNAGDLCLRCHTPTGWLGGRSDPVNGSLLDAGAGDFEGVSCESCHRQVDSLAALEQLPSVPPETNDTAIAEAAATQAADFAVLEGMKLFDGSPFVEVETHLPVHYGTGQITNYSEATGGQYFMEADGARRGPRYDSARMHDWHYSRFHRSGRLCGTCHDISNPALASVVLGSQVPQEQAAGSYFHIERTWSEFALSAYAQPGGAPTSGRFPENGIDHAASCQDCHMPVVGGKAAKIMAPERPDLRQHDQTGGNAWMSDALARMDEDDLGYDASLASLVSGDTYPSARIHMDGLRGAGPALADGAQRARGNLQRAASIELVGQDGAGVVLRIRNHTGHKLISGFPEGRRMWLNVAFYDVAGEVLSEVNPYMPLVTQPAGGGGLEYVSGGDLTVTRDDLVYEVEMSSSLTGESKTFHMALSTDRRKDNRIPPRGFNIAEAASRLVEPRWEGETSPDYFTAEEYAGGYDQVRVPVPKGAVAWQATLYYQSTSRPYIEFLRDEIRGTANTLDSPTPSGEPQAYIVQSDPFFQDLKDWGEAIWQLWLATDGAPPVPMATSISQPRIISASPDPEGLKILVHAAPGSVCQLQSADSLVEAHWGDLGSAEPVAGASVSLVDPSPPTEGTRFYRVVATLP